MRGQPASLTTPGSQHKLFVVLPTLSEDDLGGDLSEQMGHGHATQHEGNACIVSVAVTVTTIYQRLNDPRRLSFPFSEGRHARKGIGDGGGTSRNGL